AARVRRGSGAEGTARGNGRGGRGGRCPGHPRRLRHAVRLPHHSRGGVGRPGRHARPAVVGGGPDPRDPAGRLRPPASAPAHPGVTRAGPSARAARRPRVRPDRRRHPPVLPAGAARPRHPGGPFRAARIRLALTPIMTVNRMPAAEVDVSADLVRRLLADQHPDLARLPVEFLANGWDNELYWVGDALVARLPRRALGAQIIKNEQRWLPELAPRLPLPIPYPERTGAPACGYPYSWSVVPYLPGVPRRPPVPSTRRPPRPPSEDSSARCTFPPRRTRPPTRSVASRWPNAPVPSRL